MHSTLPAASSAQYYNSDLSIWLSVDPLVDKYPNLSPYTYCADNPVRLVDEDGRAIWIVGEDGKKYRYDRYGLYDNRGNDVSATIRDRYVSQVYNALQELANSSNDEISSRLDDLISNSKKQIIQDTKKLTIPTNICVPMDNNYANPDVGCGSYVFFNSKHHYQFPDGAGSNSSASLAHELLGHAFDNCFGISTDMTTENGIPFKEVSAINIQNIILKEHGLRTRSVWMSRGGESSMEIPSELLNSYFTKKQK